ncbi:MAG: PPC domain-containing protein [Vicinamibacteria bacterium]
MLQPLSRSVGLVSCLALLAVVAGSRPSWAQSCPGPQPEVEPNDTPATATTLVPTNQFQQGLLIPVPGSIATPGDEDYFRIPATQGQLFWIVVDTSLPQLPGGSRDSIVDVFDPGLALLQSDDDDGTAFAGDFPFYFDNSVIAGLEAPTTGTYTIRVRSGAPGTSMAYRLLIGIGPASAVATTFPGDVDVYSAGVFDLGRPMVLVDGRPGAEPGSDMVIEARLVIGLDWVTIDSSGEFGQPAEGALLPSIAPELRVTTRSTFSGERPYRIAVFYQGDTCQLPVSLQSFAVE